MSNIIKEFDTIAAISTPPGEGAISIVRLSGSEAVRIANSVFNMGESHLSSVSSHTIHYGHIFDPKRAKILDEVMLSVMRAPRTFTREEVVEINTHGGTVVVNQVLQLLLRQGARLAEPGEFTKRAFLNGRIDLSQAEAVMDVIRAKTDQAMQVAVSQLDGDLSKLIRHLRQEILETLAQVEVNIDYPEYDDVETLTTQLLLEKTSEVNQHLDALLRSAKQGKILREGLKTAIIGRPNVGKSSLLNHLLQEDKAIVTEIAGTTRDVIEEYVNINGVPLKLIDTAGIRETDDIVEKIGVERSRQALDEAELILLVLNASETLTEQDIRLIELTDNHKRIVLLNKTDLVGQLDLEELKMLGIDKPLLISVLNKDNLNLLETAISQLFFEAGDLNNQDATYISNTRHISLIEKAKASLDEVEAGIEAGMPVDIVQMDMTRCWDYLGEVVGDSVQDELITQLFSQFCLGK
ncbi:MULTISPECIES: tRNA uridine-5-carboxymethylaminomethyl(34) synthesis GTPase MnmE [unclassified Enterococcus]|uniref:tRNA uridine-5-carboxymethylaminomethyl(34) synthesis GTPase MnmE n=1 Tax=unclassified Enterococcus TaxID=2608891 RepID=UPI0015555DA2|nr:MULTISPECIES: tRNA uridine-5-carboxymethylaminomethyl(34) synthesis GTPase MnmE [unclassified Enterococcus]MBS7575916.1 tRNA uridine-5-carboxymethylaminomethyl(34) synthesis GTPase MnmE [Enterococcus sp. MMGLQ5-2]MBS7583149.1 tRNA uridine-5-carboxymethylaminomethyl(34) synthesis GTPase MnmE [Enterococcus sp. MMGLQ5-1]NPD11009.1 tRNA uridine-5-carboxymethylaminomethyl(34) synthesis GTPase MnmE [Enterococcus sp. MMGLQ5-1]NPD35752.1 tRNA uridine-5-carboxymethylaminomethyl(34) synthesis GTPase M